MDKYVCDAEMTGVRRENRCVLRARGDAGSRLRRCVPVGVALTLMVGFAGACAEGSAARTRSPTVASFPLASLQYVESATDSTSAPAPAATIIEPSAQAEAPSPSAPAPAATIEPSAQAEAPTGAPPGPALDLAALETRLRDTDSIGLLTKIALKNQINDLLERFREHYLSGPSNDVASLRTPYDLLVLKVLALVQDGDPPLAGTIAGSREAIWSILADREKFNAAI